MTRLRPLPPVVKRDGFWDATCPECHEYRADTGKREIHLWAKTHLCTESADAVAFATFADLAHRREELA